MKTILFIVGAIMVLATARSQDIGVYPSTTWASTNLLVNRALETGQVGQAIGYVAPGTVGVVDLGAGGGGRADVVIGQDTVESMTNNVMPDLEGLERVIVSNPSSTAATLYQVGVNGSVLGQSTPLSSPWEGATVTWETPTQARVQKGSSSNNALGLLADNRATTGQMYTITFKARASRTTEVYDYGTSSQWQPPVTWHTSRTLTTNESFFGATFNAEAVDAIRMAAFGDANPATADDYIVVRDFVCSGPGFFPTLDGITRLPSLNTNLTWNLMGDIYPDAPADGKPYARADNAWVPAMRVASATISDPELVYATSPIVPLLSVESVWAPNGIRLKQIFIKTDAASTYSLVLNRRPDPIAAGTNVVTVATSANAEAQSATLTNIIYAGEVLCWTLPATDVKWIHPTLIYTVLP